MTIRQFPISTGYAVSFPFELKDNFRTSFPSATWDAVSKVWKVGPRSKTRLETWVAEAQASGVVEEIADRDASDMKEEELARMKADLASIKSRIEAARKSKTSASEILDDLKDTAEQIEAKRSELNDAGAELKAAEDLVAAERKRIEEMVAPIVTINAIENLRYAMKSAWRVVTSKNRDAFDEAQSKMLAIHEKLKAAGIKSEAVIAAANANWNRKDRDLSDLSMQISFEVRS